MPRERRCPSEGAAGREPSLATITGRSAHGHFRRSRLRARLRDPRHRVRRVVDRLDPRQARGQRADAGDRRRDPGGRQGLPQPPVHDDRHRRRDPVRAHRRVPRLGDGGRLRARRGPVRAGGLHRHERLGALERAHGGSRADRPQRGAGRRVPRRRDHRHAGGRPGPARRGRLLLVPDRRRQVGAQPDEGRPAPRDPAARRPRVRRLAHLDLRASWRRHLHQGCGRRRRPRGQGRGGHSRGRPAQPGGDRGQRRRQRRRLRRHGGGPVRDLRGDDHRDDAARRADAAAGRGSGRHLSAGARRLLDHRLDHRLLLRQGRAGRQDHERPVQGPDRRRAHLGGRLLVHHAVDDGRRGRRGSDADAAAPVRRGDGRPRAHRRDGRDHRVLHRHGLQAGQARRAGLDDGSRHQHHRRPRRVDALHGLAGARRVRRDLRVVLARGPLRHRDRGHRHAVDGGHHRRARRLRPDHRQRGRHRRDGRAAGVGARDHRSARRRRQHDEGGDQGLRDRLGRPRRAGALRRLHARARDRGPRHDVRPVEPHGDHRAVHRRPHPLPVRRHGDGSGRPRRGLGGRSKCAASSARSRASWKARRSRSTASRSTC